MLDLDRLARAVHLTVEVVDRGRWRVRGGRVPHDVARVDGGALACDCADASFGGRVCKHSLAVRLRYGDGEVLQGLRELVPLPKRRGKGRPASPAPVYGANGAGA